MRKEDKPEYWDRKWALREQRLREKVSLDGSDGEREFDREVRKRAQGKKILDIGCGPGEFKSQCQKQFVQRGSEMAQKGV